MPVIATFSEKRDSILQTSIPSIVELIRLNTYEVYITYCFRDDKELYEKVKKVLSQEMEIVNKLIREMPFKNFTIEIHPDGKIALNTFATWFHGQMIVNEIISNLNIKLERDYDGETKIATKVKEITKEEIEKALKRLQLGIKLYKKIKKAQIEVAEKIAKEFANSILKNSSSPTF